MIKVITYTLLILLIGKPGISQIRTEIDSLHHKLENADQDTSRVILMTDLGYWYLSINPDSSMMFGNRALVLAQQIKYLRGQARSLATLGNTTRFLGDIPKGMELLFDGLQISKKYDFPFESALCLNDIGVIYADELQDYSKALIYFSQARLFYNRAHHNTMEEKYGIFFDIDAGISYQQTGQLDSSLFYRQRSLNKAISLQSGPYPVTLMMMGDLQFEMGNPKLAMEYLHESIRVNQKSFDPRTAAEAYNSLAGYFRIMKQPDSSVFYAKKALADAQSINHKQAILKASILLAGLYESANIDEAYKYLKIARIVNEELYGARKVQNLQRLISTQQERQRETEAAKIAYQNQLKQYALLAGLGIMFLFGFILYRNDRQKQKANKVLVATLSNLKSTQSQLIQSEKMASLGELTAGTAHEIQNPLNFVNNFSEVSNELIEELKVEKLKVKRDERLEEEILNDISSNLEKINTHGKRAGDIVKGMLQHSRTSTGQKELTDINALCDEYLRLSYHGLRAKDKSFNAKFETDFDSSTPKINVIPQDIGRVVLNLINNAFYAVNERLRQAQPDKGYEPLVKVITKNLRDKIQICVQDNGSGISNAIKEKIFQPFFTTKPTGQGTGLGLSLSYDIVKAHGGELKVETKHGEGSKFIIQLPFNSIG